ncbi:hypothetical protein SK854_41770 [Lentzea sp. BCCO 10_0061]|uniref:YkuD domain-containing protein n=1 Tax=Lentzea sokolovensis TaxID=3095429 RepID=A0ABU4VA77_9PSEU|nr:hypothetical protein [Lentzea sp. BCCO 10_0061]MDX8148705.1 hypothetical protein [Lentzea sp. BCCO 10_0061]
MKLLTSALALAASALLVFTGAGSAGADEALDLSEVPAGALAVKDNSGNVVELVDVEPNYVAVDDVSIRSGKSCTSVYNCVEVLGSGLRVDSFKGRTAMSYPEESKKYHFEMWIGTSWHKNTPDKTWDGTIWPGYVDSGWVTANHTAPRSVGACSRLWLKRQAQWVSYYPPACLLLTR